MEKKKLIQENPKREEDAGRIINIVSHQLKRTIFCYAWKDCGLTTMQNRVLHYILAKSLENPVYQKDIEKEFKVSKSTVTEILQLMEKNGFIIRKKSDNQAKNYSNCTRKLYVNSNHLVANLPKKSILTQLLVIIL